MEMVFSWNYIGEDCIFTVADYGCHIETISLFRAELSLRLINKLRALLEGWSIELMINIELMLFKGYHYYIVIINYFIIWTEVLPI